MSISGSGSPRSCLLEALPGLFSFAVSVEIMNLRTLVLKGGYVLPSGAFKKHMGPTPKGPDCIVLGIVTWALGFLRALQGIMCFKIELSLVLFITPTSRIGQSKSAGCQAISFTLGKRIPFTCKT